MNTTPVRVIVDVVTSDRDRNGNCYHFATFTNPAKGRHARVSLEVGGESNAHHIANLLAGGDWEATYITGRCIPKREWQACRRAVGPASYEGDAGVQQKLADLFDVSVSVFAKGGAL